MGFLQIDFVLLILTLYQMVAYSVNLEICISRKYNMDLLFNFQKYENHLSFLLYFHLLSILEKENELVTGCEKRQ